MSSAAQHAADAARRSARCHSFLLGPAGGRTLSSLATTLARASTLDLDRIGPLSAKTPQDRSRGTRRRAQPGGAAVRIVATCIAWWAVALWLVSRIPAVEAAGIRVTVLTVRTALQLAGLHVQQIGRHLAVGGAGIEIAPDCSPHLPYLLFAGAVLASPATWRQRIAGLALGALVIHVFNSVRILALIGVLALRPALFEFAHVYLWQIGTLVVVIAAFALWLPWTAPRSTSA
ncbi:MAG: archaeosortase/exosortase family protein [Candidatus Eisenbacteria bacterium]